MYLNKRKHNILPHLSERAAHSTQPPGMELGNSVFPMTKWWQTVVG
jgi:hypothetical protein